MKKFIAFVGAIVLIAVTSQAQTNPPPSIQGGLKQIGEAVLNSTNWVIVGGGGRGLTGNRWLVFGGAGYNFNNNAGAVVAVDEMLAHHKQQEDVLQGGITLQLPLHPLGFIGATFLTNIVATPFVSELLANPVGNTTAPVGEVTTAGANLNITGFVGLRLGVGGQVENRQGQGYWNGNYALAHLDLARGFGNGNGFLGMGRGHPYDFFAAR